MERKEKKSSKEKQKETKSGGRREGKGRILSQGKAARRRQSLGGPSSPSPRIAKDPFARARVPLGFAKHPGTETLAHAAPPKNPAGMLESWEAPCRGREKRQGLRGREQGRRGAACHLAAPGQAPGVFALAAPAEKNTPKQSPRPLRHTFHTHPSSPPQTSLHEGGVGGCWLVFFFGGFRGISASGVLCICQENAPRRKCSGAEMYLQTDEPG